MSNRIKKLTQDETKLHNQRLVLKVIYDAPEISRADIARATGLTPTTVSGIVGDLMQQRLVVETGVGYSQGGKPPILLGIDEDARQLIALDLSNTRWRGALLNLRGKILARAQLPREQSTGKAALELVDQLVSDLLSAATAPVLGVGIGSPGLVDTPEGVVKEAVNLGWRDLALGMHIHAGHDELPAYVANDGHLAALAEYSFGSGTSSGNLLVVKIGQGIGLGLMLNGRLFHGDGLKAGEIGHIVVVTEDGERCLCGNVGCLETVASVRSLKKQAQALMRAGTSPALAEPGGEISWDALCEAAAHDENLQALIRRAGSYLGTSLAFVVGTLDVGQIVIGGRIVAAGDLLIEAVRAELRRRILPALAESIAVQYSTLGDDIVLMGATALVLTHELGVV